MQIGTKSPTDIAPTENIPKLTPKALKITLQQEKSLAVTPFSTIPTPDPSPAHKNAFELNDEEKRALAKRKKRKLVKAVTKIPLLHQLPLSILPKRQPLNRSNPLPQPNPNNQHQTNPSLKKEKTRRTNRQTSPEENTHRNKPNTYRTPKINTAPAISRLPHDLRTKTRNPPPTTLWPEDPPNEYPIELFDTFVLPDDDKRFEGLNSQ